MPAEKKDSLFAERMNELSKTYVLRTPLAFLVCVFLFNAHGRFYQAVSLLIAAWMIVETCFLIAYRRKQLIR
jgi:uncharacterized membrane protein (GlpM family)